MNAAEFLGVLRAGSEGLTEIRAIKSDAPPGDRTRQGYFRDLDEAAKFGASFDGDRDVYVGAGTRMRESGKREDVQEIPGFWADCDTLEAVERLKTFSLRPTLTVETSPGRIHAWWLGKEPVRIEDETTIGTVEGVLRGIAARLGSDPNVCDLARIMRLPGTRNMKRGGVPCRVLSHDGPRYDIEDFIELGIFQEPITSSGNGHDPSTRLDTAAVLAGVAEGHRDRDLFRFICKLRRADVPQDVAERLALEAASKCKPAFSPSTVREKVRRAYRRYPAGHEPEANQSGGGAQTAENSGRHSPAPPGLSVGEEHPGSPITLREVVAVFRKWLHLPDAGPLYVILGAYAANRMSGDPIWILLIGTPSCGKSELIQSLVGLPDIHPAATLTEPALLSGTSRKERAKEAKGGLLLVMGSFGIILCKDFGSILNMNRDARASVIAALREIFDGSWTRHVGTDGGRTLHWDGKAGLIGGCTPSIDRHHAVMGAMGERFAFYRIGEGNEHAVAAVARRSLDNTGRESEMRRELADAVSRLFASMDFETPRRALTDDDKERLIALATFVVKARSAVERDGWNREIELIPGAESPPRLVKVLSQLLAGLDTIGLDRTEAWRVVTKVAFDSIPALRRSILEALNRAEDTLDTTDVAQAVAYPRNTTVRGLEDLTAYHVIDRIAGGQGTAHRWRLSAWSKDKLETVGGFPEMSDGVLREDTDEGVRALNTPYTTHDDFSGEVPPTARMR